MQSLIPYQQNVGDRKRHGMSSVLSKYGKTQSEQIVCNDKENLEIGSKIQMSKVQAQSTISSVLHNNTFNATNVTLNLSIHN